MMTWWRALAVRCGLALARWGGWSHVCPVPEAHVCPVPAPHLCPPCTRTHLPDDHACPPPVYLGTCPRVHLDETVILEDARWAIRDVDGRHRDTSGEFRRRETLRMLLNRHPAARERDLAFAIEAAIQETP